MAAIILAAGSASRMGRLKQLQAFEGKTLVARAIDTALEAGFDPVLVVVGAEAGAVQASVASQRVSVVQNGQWADGMGSSIRAGIHQLQMERTDVAAALISLADQPLVTARHLSAMRTAFHQNGASIVAAEYSGTVGVPALFSRRLFDTLATLAAGSGAKSLFTHADIAVHRFPLPEAAIDIDTPADLAALEARGS